MRLVLEIRLPPNFSFYPSNMSLQTSVPLLSPFPASPSRNLTKHKSSHRIRFLHPGYSDDHNLLLNLSAFDTLGPPYGGIHYGTAFLACAIVAGNSWSGYLTESTRDGNRVKHQVDAILRSEQYYFHVPIPEDQSSLPAPIRFSFADSSYHKYPVCPSFRNWKVSSTPLYCCSYSSWIFYLSVSTPWFTSFVARTWCDSSRRCRY